MTARRTRSPSRSATGLIAIRIAVPVAIVAGWWLASANSTDPYYPPLADIVDRFHELWLFAHAGTDIVPSLAILWSGFLAAVALGVALGIALALLPRLRATVMPVITFYRALPGVALIPVFVQMFGFGDGVRFAIVVLAALPPVLIATLDGVLGVDPTTIDVARAYGLPLRQRLLSVYLPGAGPRIATGVQVSLQFSFIAVIAAEMIGSTRGIGYQTLLAQQTFASADMWAGVLLLGVIGYASSALVVFVRNSLLRWYDGAQAVARSA